MKLITLTLNITPTEPTNYKYRVDIQNNNGSWTSGVFYGKFYAFAGQTTVTLDLDDLFYNFRYVGSDSIEPVLNTTDNQYEMPNVNLGLVTDYYYSAIMVASIDDTTAFSTVTKTFWFVPEQAIGYSGIELPASGIYIPIMDNQPTPHIPSNPPDGFNFSQMVYSVTASLINVKGDNTNLGTVYPSGANRPYHFPLASGYSKYTINDYTVGITDTCNKPYYLVWLTNNGALQCQGFLKSSEFSVTYQNNNRVDLYNAEWKVNGIETGNWKLKSTNLSDADYKAYGEMFNSPYVVLLDMENNRLHYVSFKTTDYKEKKWTRNDTKPKYFEVEVMSSDHPRI